NVYQNRASLFEGKTVVSGLKSDWYWSSSEFYSLPADYALFVNVSNGRVNLDRKSSKLSFVRPVLAF
ncbi:fimbrillin family protein, partial [Bacteroides fragilis]|nr:fimbrillin family protein [Bacteroides fragilis]